MTVTRFPPSPTGYLHIGGARTALYSWLHARQNNGKFVLRIEDTDLERSTPESVQAILDGMQWLGLDCDEGPYYQTQRFERYKEVVNQLLDGGDAYHCECSKERLDEMREQQKAQGKKAKYDGRCRELGLKESENTVVRFKNPLGGDDHINNTPRQINILAALGAELPLYGHVPMILGEDGARLSKRHGAVSVMQYRDEGFLPEALLNYLVRLGWSHGDQEIFSQADLLRLFKIEDVSRSASAFNPEKLLWVNQEYIKTMTPAQLLLKAKWYFEQACIEIEGSERNLAVIELIQERCKTLCDVVEQSRCFFEQVETYDAAALKKWIKVNTPDLLKSLIGQLDDLLSWDAESIHSVLQAVVDQHDVGFAKVAQPVRISLTGGTNSPSIDHTLALLGKKESLHRLSAGLVFFSQALDDRIA